MGGGRFDRLTRLIGSWDGGGGGRLTCGDKRDGDEDTDGEIIGMGSCGESDGWEGGLWGSSGGFIMGRWLIMAGGIWEDRRGRPMMG